MKTHIPTTQVNKVFIISVLFCLMLSIQSCQGVSPTPTPSSIPSPSLTPSPEEVEARDCLWRATGKAWNDNNQNGIWNSGEKPLADVKFWVDDLHSNSRQINKFLADTVATNADGRVEISVWLPGCSEVELEVYTEAPQNCELTTPEQISVNPKNQYPMYSFGFICH